MSSYFPSNHSNVIYLPIRAIAPQPVLRPEEEEEVMETASEDALQAIDPEDVADDGGWWYRCRACDRHTRIRTKVPKCCHCGFSQTMRGVL